MNKQTTSTLDLDTKILSEFIYALNIARRHVTSYPPGHPVINKAAEKLLALFPRMFEFRTDIIIGIARDTLLVEGHTLETSNPVYRDFAGKLFDAGVASITINKDASASEICSFFEILRYKTEDLHEQGGLQQAMARSKIEKISVQNVDFKAFHATEVETVHAPKSKLIENETVVLWKSFVNGLIAETIDPDGEKVIQEASLDPEILAEIINREEAQEGVDLVDNYEEAITSFLKEADRQNIQNQACQKTLGQLGELVGKLNPELRRRFLNSTLKFCSNRQDIASEVLGQMPHAQILEAMQLVDAGELTVPQALMDVLGKFGRQADSSSKSSRISGKIERSSKDTANLIHTLFKADAAGQFVPQDYQDALSVLAAAESLPGLDSQKVKELVDTLDIHSVDHQCCNVMIDLIERGTNAITTKAINRNLEELIPYFLETGDFETLIGIYDHLFNHAKKLKNILGENETTALQVFETREFVDLALDSLDTWGKSQYDPIKSVIKRVGEPFVEPLLDRLASEPRMSRRRLIMEYLLVVGSAAKTSMEARLHDRRWFFVRNLVILLRAMNDPSVLKSLGRLVGYSNAKVKYEVMKTFLHFKDPRADLYLLKELDSNDPETILNAARLAGNSRNPDVACKLSDVLQRKLSKDVDESIKRTVISSLAEMAMPEALPGLSRFLLGRSLIQSMKGNSLKIEAVNTLTRFNHPSAAALAEEVCQKHGGDLAKAANLVCQYYNRKTR